MRSTCLECERPSVALGLCVMHYKRRRAGRPLAPEPANHGRATYGELTVNGEGKIRCHECGKWVHALGSHIRVHELSVRDYKLAYGLPLSRGLVSPGTHAKLAASSASRVGGADWERLVAHRDPAAASQARDPDDLARGAALRSPETARSNGRSRTKLTVKTCPYCGAQWCPVPGMGEYRKKLCGRPECLRAHGQATGPRPAKTDRDRAVVFDIDSGMSRHDVGAKYGIGTARVGQILRRAHRSSPFTTKWPRPSTEVKSRGHCHAGLAGMVWDAGQSAS